jgi:hypothetical protein
MTKGQITMAKRSRRDFLVQSTAIGASLAAAMCNDSICDSRFTGSLHAAEPADDQFAKLIDDIKDPGIRAGMDAAIRKNMIPAAVEEGYPGHFNISADGGAYGGWATWPGLDSWQMAGAYLLLGHKTRMVLDYFDFVKAFQKPNGDIPFAIFTSEQKSNGTTLNGLKYPQDVIEYVPPKRDGLPESSQKTRKWIGLFEHWMVQAETLSTLGSVCYILTAAEIFDHTKDQNWLKERLPSIELAAKYLLSRKSDNGLIAHSGFYTEVPPRYGWDGVAQCYVVHAFRELARICSENKVADQARAKTWNDEADILAKVFVKTFWQKDHFAEYVHQDRGLVDTHGLSDTNFAAIAFRIADEAQRKTLWPILTADKSLWWGDVPTMPITKPFSYEKWEINSLRWLKYKKVPMEAKIMHDASSMGRTWYLDAMASIVMQDWDRLFKSTQLVCAAAKSDGYWRERYIPQADGTTAPAKARKYCEYPAVLVRVVLGNRKVFY